MSQKRAKRIRRLMMALGDSGIKAEAESSHAKLIMDNRHGEYQHRCISPVRQMKKRVSAAYGGLNSFLRAELMKRLREHELSDQPGENPTPNPVAPVAAATD